MKTCCQAGSFALIIESASRYSADRQQATAAAWPPRAVAVLTLLPASDRLKAMPACPPTHPRSLSPSRARLRNHESKATAVAIALSSRVPSPSCLARSS